MLVDCLQWRIQNQIDNMLTALVRRNIVTGHWYGFVNPEDVPALVEHHIGKGETADWIWRGQMGLCEEQKKSLEQRLQVSGEITAEKSTKELTQRQMNEVNTAACGSQLDVIGCCQGEGNSCYQNLA
ncbi:hypothetical protein CFOL_v3_33748 [Cephalotus follicularis]|uniref:Uncharacterized protein n=1 Tax=Cephalotus follicularis TaxID=3775 RepID=A0A1Q3DD31_CEPFO|nr:hypothetical protein CFOL_v3_33748 [Cephalotus follicularis]